MKLLRNETVIKEGKANFFKSTINQVGGKLYLTNQRIIFEAHAFNFGGKTNVDLDLNQLVRSQSGRTNLVSGEIELFDKYHNKYVFTVYDRKSWAEAIETQIVKRRNSAAQTTGNTTIINQGDNLDKLKKLKALYDEGVITEQEYNEKRKKILDNI